MRNEKLLMMIEASYMASFALVLDLLPSIKLSANISISFAMVPVFIVALRWGAIGGILSGFIWGLLQVAIGDAQILTPLQGLIEYFLAFASVGVAGIMSSKVRNTLTIHKAKALAFITLSVCIGSIARYFWHFIAGIVFWGEYAPKGMSPVLFSLLVNGGTMLGAAILCMMIINLLVSTAPRLLFNRKNLDQIEARKIS